MGLRQLVTQPTRQKSLLDLARTDAEDSKAKVLPNIVDHAIVQVTMKWSMPESTVVERKVLQFCNADWTKLNADLAVVDWSFLRQTHTDQGAAQMTETILHIAEQSI